MKRILILTFIFCCIMAAGAIDFNFSENPVTEEKVEQGDYLFFGNELSFSGKVDNFYFVGKKLNFSGSADSGITAIGEQVVINGTAKNDSHIGARTVEIGNNMEGTLFLAGQDITINESATIEGDLLVGAEIITINGLVKGDVYIGAGKVVINGTVEGNLFTKTGKVLFGEKGRVEGNMEYSSDWKLPEKDKVKISGTVDFKEWKKDTSLFGNEFKDMAKWLGPVIRIICILSFLLAGILLLLLPPSRALEEKRTEKHFLFTLLWGLIPFFVYPVFIVLTTVLGIVFGITVPIALLLLLLGFPLLVITQILGITLFGQLLFRVFQWKIKSRYLFFLFGLAFGVVLSFIPVLSIIGFISFSAVGWGRILETILKIKFGNNEAYETGI